ncbi:MAG: FG-GAP-like repeat-containing protein [Ignavibacteria bacterium]
MKNSKKIILVLFFNLFTSLHLFSTPINQFINSVSPPMNANSVVKSSDIVISFEQILNGSTMTSANVKVFGYETGLMAVSLDYNSVANTLTINPVNNFKNGEKISITLTSGIKTITNLSISPFVFSFIVKTLGGTGLFTNTSEIISEGKYIRSGDIDLDGDIDLVIQNKIFKNDGLANFTYYSLIPIIGFTLLADFDNDNDLDILVSNSNVNYLFSNNGLGNFQQVSSFSGSLQNYGDLDGNGYLDLVYFSPLSAKDINISKNYLGDFSFDTTYNVDFNLTCGPHPDFDKRILIDDMTNNGILDLILTNGNAGGGILLGYDFCQIYSLLKNNGAGIYIPELLFTHSENGLPYWGVDIGDPHLFDKNNDGLIDIVSPGLIIQNNGNGLFSMSGKLNAFSITINGDFNGDSNIDILAMIGGVSPLLTHLNDGTGNFQQYFIGSNSFYSEGYTTSDFDNDGDLDVAIELNSTKVAILLNGDSPLPVELSSFTSSINLNSVKLNWSTSSEQNNSGFEIQRADKITEGQEGWKKIDFINGAGNSNTEKIYSYEDKNLASGKYKYRLKQIAFNGNLEYHELSNEVVIGIPSSTELMQNYPNPFNPVTNISYRLSENGFVSLRVFDNSGREVKTLVNEFKEAGYYTNVFNGSDLASGVYFYKLSFGDFVQTKKLSLVK